MKEKRSSGKVVYRDASTSGSQKKNASVPQQMDNHALLE